MAKAKSQPAHRAGFRCPKCDSRTVVRDSRSFKKESAVRRRRQCLNGECKHRFTSVEMCRIRGNITVVKRNGVAEPFDRTKMEQSMRIALAKRHITEARLRACADIICDLIDSWNIDNIKRLPTNASRRITSAKIGFLVSESLKELDPIGYIRYMSVWKKFYTIDDFQNIIDSLYQSAEPDPVE